MYVDQAKSFDDARAFGWRYAFGLLACPWFGVPLLGVCVPDGADGRLVGEKKAAPAEDKKTSSAGLPAAPLR